MTFANGRAWLVELERRGGAVAGHIVAGGRTLLPTLLVSNPRTAMEYVEWALVDMRDGDSLELCVHDVELGAPLRLVHASQAESLTWLAQMLGLEEKSDVPARSISSTQLKPVGEPLNKAFGRSG